MRTFPFVAAASKPTLIALPILVTLIVLFAHANQTQAQDDHLIPLPGGSTAVEAEGKACITHTDPINVSWFYKPPENVKIGQVTKSSDLYILTRNDEKYVAKIHKKGEGPVMQYLLYDAVHDPCQQARNPVGTPCSCYRDPLNNNVGWNPEDICWIRDNHPEWFLRDADGNLIYAERWGVVMMDPGQLGWRDFWISRVREGEKDGWDGVFIDNLNTRFTAHASNDDIVLENYTLETYRDAVTGFLQYVYQSYFQPNNKKFMANLSVHWGDTSVFDRYSQYLDGAMDEFWAYPRSGWYSVKSWEDRLKRMGAAVQRGETAILVSQGKKKDQARVQFGLASYLLIAEDNASFRYTRDNRYEMLWNYDNYSLKLGEPLGTYQRSGNTWTRNFANGKVTVNPENQTSSIVLYDEDGIVCN
jgi:hypothetical protein